MTMFPYSQYIRVLSLRDLEKLLRDPKFGAKASKHFFQDALARFKAANERWYDLSDITNVINRIGEVVTKQTPLLEELGGKIRGEELSRWIPQLPRLTHLDLWSDSTFEGNGNLIRLHCPSFQALKVWYRIDINTDQILATFLSELRPQSLESFAAFKYHSLGPQIFQALSRHEESLIQLTIEMLPPEAIPQISLLKGCKNLAFLSLSGDGLEHVDLEESHNDAFLEIVTWLKGCKKLQILGLSHLFSAHALITPVLLENSIHLTSLEYGGLGIHDFVEFHQALANQTSLQGLWLGEEEDMSRYFPGSEVEVLVESLSKLVNLTDLRFRNRISDKFTDAHIVEIASSLSKLEILSISGDMLTDAIWDAVASLRSLRILDIGVVTNFTADGILDFIEKLGPGNRGLFLAVAANFEGTDLSAEEVEVIQEKIAEKVEGIFEFVGREHGGIFEDDEFDQTE